MKYDITLWLRDKDGRVIKSVHLHTLDLDDPKTCDSGYAISPSEVGLIAQTRDISVTVRERSEEDTEICTKGPNGFHWCSKEEEHEGKCKCNCGKEFGDAPNAAIHEG